MRRACKPPLHNHLWKPLHHHKQPANQWYDGVDALVCAFLRGFPVDNRSVGGVVKDVAVGAEGHGFDSRAM